MDAAYWRLLAVVEAKEAERAEWVRKLGDGRVLAPDTWALSGSIANR